MALDYKSVSILIEGRRLDSFRVSGFAAEEALRVSRRVGCSGLGPQHLPDTLDINVGSGLRKIKLHPENRTLGVSVAKAVRAKLNLHGMEMVHALVEVRRPSGKRWGEHDLIVEIVSDGRGEPPGPSHPAGFISVELRMRRLESEKGRRLVRTLLREECGDACDWWQAERKSPQRVWAGRLIVLADFGKTSTAFTTRADVQLAGEEFRGLWGWPGSVPSLCFGAAAQPQAVAPARAPRRPSGAQSAQSPVTASAPRARKMSWSQVSSTLVFRPVDSVSVAPVAGVVPRKKVAEKVAAGKLRHSWPDTALFKSARTGAKKGGSEEWVATEAVLQQLYEDC